MRSSYNNPHVSSAIFPQDLLNVPGQIRDNGAPRVSAAATIASSRLNAPWTAKYDFGYPYLNDLDTRMNLLSPVMSSLRGMCCRRVQIFFFSSQGKFERGAFSIRAFSADFNHHIIRFDFLWLIYHLKQHLHDRCADVHYAERREVSWRRERD